MSNPRRKATVKTPGHPPKAEEPTGAAGQGGQVEIFVNGVRVEVPPELEAAVQRAFRAADRPLPQEMTTTQASEFLDVSRPFVVKLVKRGELPCRMVGTHRRIPSDALLTYREKMFQRAREAADEMVQISQESGLCEIEGPMPRAR
jgi:excisionase family DNA binding protein